MPFRTDNNNCPAAFTTDIAKQAGLVLGTDYEQGDPFMVGGASYHTARLLGDPIEITIRVISAVSFYTKHGAQRWIYIGLPKFLWDDLGHDEMRDIIGFMYQREAGTAMRDLFPNYGKV